MPIPPEFRIGAIALGISAGLLLLKWLAAQFDRPAREIRISVPQDWRNVRKIANVADPLLVDIHTASETRAKFK